MDLRALVALEISAKTTNACPRILSVFNATMSRMGPNWENIAYSDFFNSKVRKKLDFHTNLIIIFQIE